MWLAGGQTGWLGAPRSPQGDAAEAHRLVAGLQSGFCGTYCQLSYAPASNPPPCPADLPEHMRRQQEYDAQWAAEKQRRQQQLEQQQQAAADAEAAALPIAAAAAAEAEAAAAVEAAAAAQRALPPPPKKRGRKMGSGAAAQTVASGKGRRGKAKAESSE